METFSLFRDLDFTFHTWDAGVYAPHKHSFFEMIYIREGLGIHTINGKHFNYTAGDFFFLSPKDVHQFKVASRTEFYVLLFNKIYFSRKKTQNGNSSDFSLIFKYLEFIILNTDYISQPIFTETSERMFVGQLISRTHWEYEQKQIFFETIVLNTVVQILCLIIRNIRHETLSQFLKNGAESTITEVIFYIQNNIYDNEKIRVSNLALKFNKSRNLFGSYFKSGTGFSPKEYILNIKFNLIKNKLLYSDNNVGEIASSLGFTDENHLNKFLKSKLGMSASAFRKQNT